MTGWFIYGQISPGWFLLGQGRPG